MPGIYVVLCVFLESEYLMGRQLALRLVVKESSRAFWVCC